MTEKSERLIENIVGRMVRRGGGDDPVARPLLRPAAISLLRELKTLDLVVMDTEALTFCIESFTYLTDALLTVEVPDPVLRRDLATLAAALETTAVEMSAFLGRGDQ